MNYYQLSYDVIDADRTVDRNGTVLKELIKTLIGVEASCVGRFVETTIMFLSEQPYSRVCAAIRNWASDQDVYYVLSQVRSPGKNEKGAETYCYIEHKNADLQSEIDKLRVQLKKEIGGEGHV